MSRHVDRPVSINSDFKTKAPAQLRLHTFYEVWNPCRGINVRHPLKLFNTISDDALGVLSAAMQRLHVFFLLYPLFTKLLIAVTLNHTYAI